MNIFYQRDTDPKACAQYRVDRHVVSQIKEYAQLLSTAYRLIDGKQSVALSKSGRRQQVWTLDDPEMQQTVYKATHVNHPISQVGTSLCDELYLANGALALSYG